MAGHRGRQPGVRGGRRYLHKVKVTHEHERRLQHLAVAHGVTVSRLLVESALTQGSASPAAWRALYADLAATKRQVTGACTNLNQLALQANAERQLPERTGELLARLWDAADALDAAMGRLDRWSL